MRQIDFDIHFLQYLLPKHYEVKESKSAGSINCKSDIGIRQNGDSDDDEHWDSIVKAIKKGFKKRFIEIDHITNFCHTNFTVYLKPATLSEEELNIKLFNAIMGELEKLDEVE